MSDRYRDDPYDRTQRFDGRRDDRDDRRRDDRDDRPRRPADKGVMPAWLAARLLRDGEKVESVRGPRFNPPWEPFVVHPATVLLGVVLAGGAIAAAYLASGGDGPLLFAAAAFALVSAFGGLAVVAFAAGFFTRLIVTDRRVMIVQGIEIRKTWRLEDLPRSLVRQTRGDDGELSRTVDMEKLQTMMGGASDGSFAEAKSIWALGKEIDRIKRDGRDDRP